MQPFHAWSLALNRRVRKRAKIKQYCFVIGRLVSFCTDMMRKRDFKTKTSLKLNYRKYIGILFCTQFPSLGIVTDKKVGLRRNYDHLVYNF